MSVALGNAPLNQLNALPLISADAAASGGVATVVFGQLTRFWDATLLGASGLSIAYGGTFRGFYMNPLDVRGCRRFALIVTHDVTALPGDVAKTLNLWLLYANAANTAAQIVSSAGAFLAGMQRVDPVGLAIPAGLGLGPNLWSLQFTDPMPFAGTGPSGMGTMVGTRVRPFLQISQAAGLADVTWSCELWGAS